MYLGVVLLEASRREKDEAGEVGRLPLKALGDSIDEQGSASQAVPYSPQPVGLVLLATALLLVPATVAAASAACLAALLAFDPEQVGNESVRDHGNQRLHDKTVHYAKQHFDKMNAPI